MKTMITLTVCLFAFLGLAQAGDDLPVTVNELPQKAQEFIKQHFPKHTVSYAKMEKDLRERKYEIVLAGGEKIEFDKNGDWKEVKCKFSKVPAEIIPVKIREHLNKQFPKAQVLKIERSRKGYEVKLDNQLEIEYNNAFQPIEIED